MLRFLAFSYSLYNQSLEGNGVPFVKANIRNKKFEKKKH